MQRLPGIESTMMDNKRTVTEICRRDTQLRKTVDQLNILVFGVDHRASEKVNSDLAEVYHEALQKVYDYAVASFNETLQQMLQDVPGLIPEEENP